SITPKPVNNPSPNVTGTQQQVPGLTIQKDGPSHVVNGQDISYSITVNYSGSLDVTIADNIDGTLGKIISASPSATLSDSSVTWKLKDLGNGPTYTLGLVVHPLKDDISISNQAIATAVGGTTG